MATLNLNDINLAGVDLFSDSENYLNEIADDETTSIFGGTALSTFEIVTSFLFGVALGYVASQGYLSRR